MTDNDKLVENVTAINFASTIDNVLNVKNVMVAAFVYTIDYEHGVVDAIRKDTTEDV